MQTRTAGSVRLPYHLPLEVLDKIISFTDPAPALGTDGFELDSEHKCLKECWLALSKVNRHCRRRVLTKLFSSNTIAYALSHDEDREYGLVDTPRASTVAFCSAVVDGDPAAMNFAQNFIKTCTICTYEVELGPCWGESITEEWYV